MTQTNEEIAEKFIEHWVDDCFSEGARKALHSLLTTTKADWLRSEIEKLEGMRKKTAFVIGPAYIENKSFNEALTTIITRYKEELKVLESKKTCEICHGFGNNGADDAQCLNCGGSGEELLKLENGK